MSKFPDWNYSFYRTASGNEIDLIIETGTKRIAVECKANTAPKITRGFWQANKDLKPDISYIVIPKDEKYALQKNILVSGLPDILKDLDKKE